jgi:hypothetical protein
MLVAAQKIYRIKVILFLSSFDEKFFSVAQQPLVVQALLIIEAS